MRLHNLGLSAFVCLLVVFSTSWVPNWSMVFTASQVLAQTGNQRKTEADRLHDQGLQELETSQFEAALQSFQQALKIYQEIKDRKNEIAALGNIGIVYNNLGDNTKAIGYYQQILVIAQEIKDRRSEGKTLGNIGNVYDDLGDYLKAIEYQQQWLAIAREIKYRKGEVAALGNIGNAYLSLGNYPKAIDYNQQGLAIAREIKDRQGEAISLGNLGIAYLSLGDYPKAIDYQEHKLVIIRDIKDRLGESVALGNLGVAYFYLGNYLKAIDYCEKQRKIAREIKHRYSEGSALSNLGLAYFSLGDYPKAIDYQQQHLAIARELKNPENESSALSNLGIAYDKLGEYPKAIDYHQQSLAIARKAKILNNEGSALSNLGVTYLNLEDYPKAIEYHQQSLEIAREIKSRFGEGVSLNNLGLAFYKSGNLSAAEKKLYEGIKVYESLRDKKLNDTNKVSIFETQRHIYRTLQKVLIAENKSDTALEIAERGRARAFVELISSRLANGNTEAKSPKPPTIAEIKQIAKVQNATLVQYSIIYDEFKVAGKPQTKESELYIWVIKPTGEVTFRKLDLKPLWQQQNTSLETVVESILQTSPSQWNKPLKQLHQILIQPIASELPKDPSDRVIFIPQQSLFRVPFPALQDEKGKYLIEQHTILTAPSIQVLQLTREQRKLASGKGFLIVGNPIMPKIGDPPKQLDPLPEAEKEAIEIADLFKTKAIIGKDATKVNILQQISKARIIHLATHGQVDDNQALGSWIALAPSGKDNGLLTAGEIFDFKFKLKAELLVLSACEAGRGRLTGDGVIGLSRSLIYAGVPSVIVSLWTVPDDSTKLLMTEFYKNLQRNPDKAQALRQAMLTTSKQYDKPVNWAAFTLIGEAE
ncbi:MAG: CHAT domain-containing protein [Tolypothrix brevis GSE-NOS-MK-07-07A]|nr:CHAT domain-containing protein [Tolypothrix brevis GSE-NOS-MK-07-07A]